MRRLSTCCLLVLVLTAGAGACAERIDTQGHYPDPEALARIQPGIQSKEEVAALIGSPTTVSTLEPNRWYYVTRITSNVAFYDPDLIEQKVLIIDFGEDGRVAEVRDYAVNEEVDIDIVERVTPTQGSDLGFFEQMIGNIGRYDRGAGSPGRGGP